MTKKTRLGFVFLEIIYTTEKCNFIQKNNFFQHKQFLIIKKKCLKNALC